MLKFVSWRSGNRSAPPPRATTASLAFLVLLPHLLPAGTRFWRQTDAADFEKGSRKQLSLRSDGQLSVAPLFTQVADAGIPYLWAAASGSSGPLYVAGGGSGTTARLLAIDHEGKCKTVADLDGLEIHALAIRRDGRILAATDPDGKVYEVTPNGKSRVFYDPHAKYIWALALDHSGTLYVATGDGGEIHRVTPDGKGAVFYKTGETHARSMTIAPNGDLIVGTEPDGLILRVSPQGNGFVIYQAPKREITAVAISRDGEIFAAGLGNKSSAPAHATPPSPAPATIQATPAPAPGAPGAPPKPPTAIASTPAASAGIAGGSELYRLAADGSPRTVWSSPRDLVYAIGFDSQNRPLLATGNRGRIYRVDNDRISTILEDAAPTQITGFAPGPNGSTYAITGNIGQVYRLGPGLAASGAFESDVLDAGSFTQWGRLTARGPTRAATVLTRAGNLNHPENNWSPWAPLALDDGGDCHECLSGRVASPAARFLQYKIELRAAGGAPPELNEVEVAYAAKNNPPEMEAIEITPPNYRFPAPAVSAAPSTSLNLPPLGTRRANPASLSETNAAATLSYAKGYVGARWLATDPNGDTLTYRVEIKGAGESDWKLLKDDVREKYVTWDGTALPDGEYQLRVIASDAPSNTPSTALSDALVSDPFIIDNSPPRISGLTASRSGSSIEVRWTAEDARSILEKAEYSVNAGEWVPVQPVNGVSDSLSERYQVTIRPAPAGEATIAVRVADASSNEAVEKAVVK